jgi:hypothetical protein
MINITGGSVAPFGIGMKMTTEDVTVFDGSTQSLTVGEAKNLWFGPQVETLVHFGENAMKR